MSLILSELGAFELMFRHSNDSTPLQSHEVFGMDTPISLIVTYLTQS